MYLVAVVILICISFFLGLFLQWDFIQENPPELKIEVIDQEPKWIPVSERLPEKGETVLTTDTLWNGRRVSIDWRNDEQWVRNGKYVIAWQPLPEPYKENE